MKQVGKVRRQDMAQIKIYMEREEAEAFKALVRGQGLTVQEVIERHIQLMLGVLKK